MAFSKTQTVCNHYLAFTSNSSGVINPLMFLLKPSESISSKQNLDMNIFFKTSVSLMLLGFTLENYRCKMKPEIVHEVHTSREQGMKVCCKSFQSKHASLTMGG